jgi:predicted nucleic acid-binding protein
VIKSAELRGLTLDTGALIAVERGDERLRQMLRFAQRASLAIDVPAGAVAQAWRGGPRQARVAQLLAQPEVRIPALDGISARAVGRLCGVSGHPDVIDVHVALHATEMGHHVVTSDPDDIRAVNPSLPVIAI